MKGQTPNPTSHPKIAPGVPPVYLRTLWCENGKLGLCVGFAPGILQTLCTLSPEPKGLAPSTSTPDFEWHTAIAPQLHRSFRAAPVSNVRFSLTLHQAEPGVGLCSAGSSKQLCLAFSASAMTASARAAARSDIPAAHF